MGVAEYFPAKSIFNILKEENKTSGKAFLPYGVKKINRGVKRYPSNMETGNYRNEVLMTVKEKDRLPSGKSRGIEIKNDDGDHRSIILKDLKKRKAEAEKILRIMTDNYTGADGSIFHDDSTEEFDMAGKEISAQTYYSLLERKRRELERLEFLIYKILNDEDFGYCEDCGESINIARLMVMPEVARCIDCQREYEKIWQRGNVHVGPSSRSNWQSNWEDQTDDSDYSNLTFVKGDMEPVSWKDLEEIEIDDKGPGEQNGSGTTTPVGGS